MTELTFTRKTPEKIVHSHDTHYWCRKGQHWVLKELADKGRLGKIRCPDARFNPRNHGWLSARICDAKLKHEEKVTRY